MGTPRVIQGDERLAYTAGTTSEVVASLGTKLVIEDGRTFRMAQCDTSAALVNARLTTSPVPSANFQDEVSAVAAAGDRVITGVGSTSAAKEDNVLRGGYLTVQDAVQLDPLHRIKTNSAINGTTNVGRITLESDLQDAIASGEAITYIDNPYRQIIIAATTPAALMTGIVVRAMAVNVYGWIATGGPARFLEDGGLVVGGGAMASNGTAGALEDWAPETNITEQVEAMPVGTVMVIEGTGVKGIVFLKWLDSN